MEVCLQPLSSCILCMHALSWVSRIVAPQVKGRIRFPKTLMKMKTNCTKVFLFASRMYAYSLFLSVSICSATVLYLTRHVLKWGFNQLVIVLFLQFSPYSGTVLMFQCTRKRINEHHPYGHMYIPTYIRTYAVVLCIS